MNSSDYDLDLFFNMDTAFSRVFTRYPIHVATAGGYFPDDIIFNKNHALFRSKLKNIPIILRREYEINPNIDEIISLKCRLSNIEFENFDRESYLSDFIEYAQCGCLSFDRTNIADANCDLYHLVAYPKGFLKIKTPIFEKILFRVGIKSSNFLKTTSLEVLFKPIKFSFFTSDFFYLECDYFTARSV